MSSSFIQIGTQQLIVLTCIFLIMLFLLFAFIVCFTIYRRHIAGNISIWEENIAGIISQAIFLEEGEELQVDLTAQTKKLLKKSRFRQYLINEILQAKKNISGSSSDNLKKLYEILRLETDSSRKLGSLKWHRRAKGIQELTMMKQTKYVKKIFRLANDANLLVRNEAQCGLIIFHGFVGLRFLNVIDYPISQWQQILLLNKLKDVTPNDFNDLKTWLQSPNESVVVFALKLASVYNAIDVYDNVILCLQCPGLQIKLSALEYLKKMGREDTPEIVISSYAHECKLYRLVILDALKELGSAKQIPFLLNQIHDTDNDIKAAAAKTLSVLDPSGIAGLQSQAFAAENPWKAIFTQIMYERAA